MQAARLRAQIESTLQPRIPGALTVPPRAAPERLLSGIAAIDALTGGIPRGALTEICGPPSSGRTSLLLALMAAITRREESVALVDAGDALDPESAAAAGVDLKRLLWVRCFPKLAGHRRQEAGDDFPASCILPAASLEQALKATDMLLASGGFGMVAVDWGDIRPQAARRIPLTSWFRFRRAVENTSTALVVVEQEPHAKTCASLVLRLAGKLSAGSFEHSAGGTNVPPHARLFPGLSVTAELLHSRHEGDSGIQKPLRAVTTFKVQAPWKIGSSGDRVI